jgi:dienelactone hydrolase
MRVLLALCTAILLALPVQLQAKSRIIDGVPVPSTIETPHADPNATGNTRFQGAWAGLWGHALKHILVVENIQPDGSATATYAYGDFPSWGIKQGWDTYKATIDGDVLTVHGNGFKATYQKLPSGVLMGNFNAGQWLSQAVLNPLPFPQTGSLQWSTAQYDMVETQLREQDQPVQLETVIFKPKGTGPFPLTVINHGSTGDGKNPQIAKFTFVDTAIAQFLTDRGYIVAFPQRRGRGKSDGLYDEGFRDNRANGYSCSTERSLEGADRALIDLDEAIKALQKRDDVAAGPVLLGGVSRGGILSMAYAGQHPETISGVLNFVGGWMAEGCPNGATINDNLFGKAAKFQQNTLWLYGENDPFYSTIHTKQRFKAFESAGGQGTYTVFDVPGGNGHGLSSAYHLWAPLADDYLKQLAPQ